MTVRAGTLVDGTVIRAASKGDRQAGWKAWGHNAPVKGYKAHMATDEAGGIVRLVALTATHVADAKGGAAR